jgi:hypothetical protein
MPTEWPGYTPPASGSSQNDGTHPLSSYTGIESALQTQYAAQGADVTQQPPQYFGNWTVQNLDHPERHNPPTAPTGVVVAGSGTSGAPKVTWVASTVLPSQGYSVAVTDGTTQVVTTVLVPATATTVNVPGQTVGHGVTAIVTALGAWVNAPSTASASFTVV